MESGANKTGIDFLTFHKKKKRPLILDGAIGTLLHERKLPTDENLWSSISNTMFPDEVKRVHKE